MQLHQNKNFEFLVGSDRNEATATSIVKALEKAEGQLQAKLDEFYENDMPTRFFKALRRIQPVTGVKMNWNMALIDMKTNLLKAAEIAGNK